MVAAGVYMLARVSFLIDTLRRTPKPSSRLLAATTALFAALLATQQDDIKRILAYSTLLQLGYMIMAIGACGAGSGDVPPLHACLVQGAPLPWGRRTSSTLCHHEQDIWKMGGLRKADEVDVLHVHSLGFLALIGFPWLQRLLFERRTS